MILAAIDATVEKETVAKYDVRGFPTIKFFADGKASEYEGQRDAASIIAWLRKKTGDPAKKLRGYADVVDFQASAVVVVVGFFQAGSVQQQQFALAARDNDNIPFGAVLDDERLANDFRAQFPGIVIFTSQNAGFDQDRTHFHDVFEKDAIMRFVDVESLPLVIAFSSRTSRQIFLGSIQKHLFFFGSFEGQELELVKQVARYARGRFVVSTIAATEQRALDFFGLDQEDLPTLRASRFDGIMRKYVYQGSLSQLDPMKSFAAGILDGSQRPQLKTEPIPPYPTDPAAVVTVVGSNFDDIVLDRYKEVFLQIYAPWCGHCKHLAPIWEQLSEKFSMYPTIIFAKMDATANEHELIEVSGFPVIQFYGMDNQLVQFKGQRDLETLAEFVTQRTGVSPVNMHDEL